MNKNILPESQLLAPSEEDEKELQPAIDTVAAFLKENPWLVTEAKQEIRGTKKNRTEKLICAILENIEHYREELKPLLTVFKKKPSDSEIIIQMALTQITLDAENQNN